MIKTTKQSSGHEKELLLTEEYCPRNDGSLLSNQPNPHQEFHEALGKCGFLNQP